MHGSIPTMNKTEAAQFLGVSPRTLEGYVRERGLKMSYVRGKTRSVADFDSGELERFKTELEAPTERTVQSPQNGAETSLARFAEVPAMQSLGGALVPIPRGQMQAPVQMQALVPVADKFLLTLEEAGAMSNVSVARLRRAIQNNELSARRIGRGYRVRPDDLRRWIDGFFEEMNQ